MNVFVAGIHAVGKSFLCTKAAADGAWRHSSASTLIKQELGSANWTSEKRVGDPDRNQKALVAAVKRINEQGTRLLLDGHFVLRGKEGEFIRLGAEVFAQLKLDAIVLIEAPAAVIAARLQERDNVNADLSDVEVFLVAEREQAKSVCEALGVRLSILECPDLGDFLHALSPNV